jgi:hypothetical protein
VLSWRVEHAFDVDLAIRRRRQVDGLQRSSVTAIAVAGSAKTRLKLKMTTKNASASSYFGPIRRVQLRRTA